MLSKSLIAAIAVTVAINASAGNDSIKVVKGQVSDYYIPVVTQYEVTGTVTDQYGRPLDGATVMWLYSPAHSNTDSQGHFSLIGTDTDVKLCVHYPGMEMVTVARESGARDVNIVMLPKHSASLAPPRRAAQATRWYDPHNPATGTYCNPLNIS